MSSWNAIRLKALLLFLHLGLAREFPQPAKGVCRRRYRNSGFDR